MTDYDDQVCRCGHSRIRHPHSGGCNRAECGCDRFRLPQSALSPNETPVQSSTEPRSRRRPDPPARPASVHTFETAPPLADATASVEPQDLEVDVTTAVDAPAEPITEPVEGLAEPVDEPVEPIDDHAFVGAFVGTFAADQLDGQLTARMKTLRSALASPYRETRELAVSCVKMLDNLEKSLSEAAGRAERMAELNRLEQQAEQLRAELGIKKRGRPARP